MSIRLKRHTEMLLAAVAVLVMTLVVLLPRVAEAQSTDGALVEAAQNSNQDAYYATASQPSPGPATRLMVVPGDSLWSISQKRLGPDATPAQIANEVEQIFEANRGQIGDDPNLIFAGQELLLSSASESITSVPVTSEPASSKQASSEPASSEPAPSVPMMSEQASSEPTPSEPAADSGRTIGSTFWQDERHLVGLGIIVLTFVLVGLMAWKLPLRRNNEEGAWEWSTGVHNPRALASQTLQISSSPNHAEVGERATSDTAVQSMKPGSETLGVIWVKCLYPVVSLGLEAGLKASGYVYCRQEEDFAENIPSSVIYFPNGGEDVVSEVERLRLVARNAPILILGLRDDPQLARTALLAGASGFVHLGMQPKQIVHALTVASEGKLVFPSKLLDELEKELMKENHPQEPSALTHMMQQQPTELRPIAPEFTSKEREQGSKISHVLLIEPHRALRQALASSLDWEPDLQVVAQTDSLAEYHNIALDEIDVALVDTSLPDGDDIIDLVGEVSSYGVPVVALASSSRADMRVRALKAGVTKLLDKNVSFEELAEATRSAVAVSPMRKGETMVAVNDRPYRELGDFLDSLVRQCPIHEPYTIATHLRKVVDYEVNPQMVRSYLCGASLPEPSFFPAFAEAFSLTAEERKELAWLYSYGYLPRVS